MSVRNFYTPAFSRGDYFFEDLPELTLIVFMQDEFPQLKPPMIDEMPNVILSTGLRLFLLSDFLNLIRCPYTIFNRDIFRCVNNYRKLAVVTDEGIVTEIS